VTDPEEKDPMVQETRLRHERHKRWLSEGDMSVGRKLAQIGVLGWIIIGPALLGLFLGRWIDAKLASGIFWTAPLMLLGLVLGFWSAWKWMNSP
jgi:ATP synthase protein I